MIKKISTLRTYAVLVIIAIFSFQCSPKTAIKMDKCNDNFIKSKEYFFNYQMTEDTLFLDSAYTSINYAITECDCSNMKYEVLSGKLVILSEKHIYDEAISIIEENEWGMKEMPYYKAVLDKRFRAMKYQYEGDIEKRNIMIESINQDLSKFLVGKEERIKSFFKIDSINNILGDELFLPILQSYFYRYQLHPKEVEKELDLIRNTTGVNNDYIDLLKIEIVSDFMDYKNW